ncbi:MAG: hypothetical protein ACXAEU_13020 [Candidatus Hodarchaeales archaeon]|jgi:archaellum component FlaC
MSVDDARLEKLERELDEVTEQIISLQRRKEKLIREIKKLSNLGIYDEFMFSYDTRET